MPLLRELSKNNEKESHKTTGSVQAYTDAKTRDREEKEKVFVRKPGQLDNC